MTPPALMLLLCGFLLCGLRETLCRRVRCVGNHCVVLLHEPLDFAGAKKRCENSGEKLFELGHEYLPKSLSDGSYWVNMGGKPTESVCSAVTGSMKTLFPPCVSVLDGVLCQRTYTASEMCGALQAGRGAQINYVTYEGFDVHDSETFPSGTIAATVKISSKYLETKHICMGKIWLAAPWHCEVLKGGCEHNCSGTCMCPAGEILQPNNITCTEGPCKDKCTGKGEECQNTKTGPKCTCKDDFRREDGECVNISICPRCEHMRCDKINGVYQCGCKKGYKVADHDPTKCEVICTDRDCPASCVHSDKGYQCYCPDGYIQDTNKGKPFCTDINECEQTKACQHKCENLFGNYRCLCNEGFTLHSNGYGCSRVKNGSSSTPLPPYATLASHQPTAVPYYVKTGSVLGIAVFVTLCAVLLCFLVRNAAKRCGKFELSSIKRPDMDLFYVQQVTTETYKRLSFDKQCKIDSVTL